jgi:hypothetical protein
MTPEQLQQYIDAALKQRDQFNLVFYPLTFVLSIGGAWLISYVREKGKNLATKEDVAEITRKQEEIRTELANHSHFSRARYDHEVEIYKNLWPKLVDFYRISCLLDPRKTEDGKSFNEKHEEMHKAIRENKPFFSDEICKELLAFQHLCDDKRFLEIVSLTSQPTEEKRNSYLELQKKIHPQLEKVEIAIRDRLIKFD